MLLQSLPALFFSPHTLHAAGSHLPLSAPQVLGRKVFSRPLAPSDKQESWMEAFYRTVSTKTQHVRAVVVGYR